MIYSPIGPISERFLLLFEFCRRRGIKIAVNPEPGWAAGRDLGGKRVIYIQPSEIENDSRTGPFDLPHEIGHHLLNLPKEISRWSHRKFGKGALLGLISVLLQETAAWVLGFLLLKLLGIATKGYPSHASSKLRTYLNTWSEERRKGTSDLIEKAKNRW